MKINSLLESQTPSSSTINTTNSAPEFGRDDGRLEETTTSGSVASVETPLGGMQRRGNGSMFAGISTSEKYPNSKAVKEEQINEVDPRNFDSDEDYYRARNAPAKRRSAPSDYPYSPEEDDAYFREIFRKKRLAAQQAERSADHDRLATGTNEGQFPDASNSLAKRTIRQAEVPNVTKNADGHPTVRGRADSTRKTYATRVEPTITPTTVKRLGGDRPIPSFLQKGVAEGQEVDASVVIGKLYDVIDHAEDMIKNADYDRQVQYATTLRDRAVKALNMIKQGGNTPEAALDAFAYMQNGEQVNEKSKSQAQFRTMAAVANNPKFAKKVGISQEVGKEFHSADKKQDYKELPKEVDEARKANTKAARQEFSKRPRKEDPKEQAKKKADSDAAWERLQQYMATHKKEVDEEKQRLDPKCWTGYKKQGTKMKGDTRVNNCVPIEEAELNETDMLAKELFKQLDLFKKGADKDIGSKAKDRELGNKPQDKDIVAKGGFNGEYDDEAGSVESNLLTTARAVKGLLDTIEDRDNLPEWVQEKIAKAEGMLVTSWDYLLSQKEQGIDPQVDEDWQKTNKQDKTDGMSPKAVKAYRRENPGSKLKTAVTKKPSELKAGSKDAKRRKSFCARMSGNKGPMKDEKGRPTPKAKALRRWNCEE